LISQKFLYLQDNWETKNWKQRITDFESNTSIYRSENVSKGTCALCKKCASLRRSHIIPKFVSKWLKETSATGFLRGVKKPAKRIQDLPKLPLLCDSCEQNFSKLESYFASKVFYPILNEKQDEITYNDTLQRFIISINWRTLITGYSTQVKLHPWIKEHLDKAEERWRKHLLQGISKSEPYEHHMFFIGFLKNEVEIPQEFQFYALRATDSTLASNSNEVFAYTHFPHVFLVSTIVPLTFSGWKNTKISLSGKFSTKSTIDDYYFWGFLVSRCKIISSLANGFVDEKIMHFVEKYPKRFLKSETLKVLIEKSKTERRERIQRMPKSIQALIDVIDRSVDNLEFNTLQQGWANYVQHMVASALSRIPLENAKVIDELIQSAFLLADEEHRHSQCHFETQELIASFMVDICDSRIKQIGHLNEVLTALIRKKASNDERIIVVFSFNPLDEEMPYQTAYYAG
jgi:5-methylcytosine-specific restriction endonuclease McrA